LVTLPYPSNQPTTHTNQSAKEFINVTQDGDGLCWAGYIIDKRSHTMRCAVKCSLVTSKVRRVVGHE
jgi:hypothetical protein